MNDGIKETAILLRDEIARAKDITSETDVNDVFLSAETIVSCLSFLISPIADMEQKYRLLIVSWMESGDSHAAAEAKAKASNDYKDWKKYSALYELGHEQIMLLKKFRDDIQKEYKRS